MLESYFEGSEKAKLVIKNKFKNYVSGFKDFSSIDEEKHEELKKDAKVLYERFINGEKVGGKYYNLLSYLTLLPIKQNIYSKEELISVLIETIDPELEMFKISHRSKSEFETEKKINSKFGFYDPELINYEREYARKFFRRKRKSPIKILEP